MRGRNKEGVGDNFRQSGRGRPSQVGPFDPNQQERRVQSMYIPEGRVFQAKRAARVNASWWEEPAGVEELSPTSVAGIRSGEGQKGTSGEGQQGPRRSGSGFSS